MQTFYGKVTWGQALFLFRFVDKIPAGARNRECMRTAKIGPDLRLTIKNSRSHNWDRPLIISNNLHSISFPHFLFLLCRIMPCPHYTGKCLLRRENHTEEVLFTNFWGSLDFQYNRRRIIRNWGPKKGIIEKKKEKSLKGALKSAWAMPVWEHIKYIASIILRVKRVCSLNLF